MAGPRARAGAAHLRCAPPMCSVTSPRPGSLGLAILAPEKEIIHVTRRGVSGGRLEHGVKHHLAPYQSDQVVVVEGVPVLNAARTAVDMAREHGYVHGTVACDARGSSAYGCPSCGRPWRR